MKDAISDGLDLLCLKDASTKKAFDSIPPKKIQLLHKSLAKAKVKNQLGVASSGKKDKHKCQRDLKKGSQIFSSTDQLSGHCADGIWSICSTNQIFLLPLIC